MSTRQEAVSARDTKSASEKSDSTTQRVADAAHNAIDETAVKAETLERKMREGAAKAVESVENSQEAAGEQLNHAIAQAEAFAKKRPVAAAGIAFAAGILVAAALRR
jgi:ElaB/YqjD/DUF883 family membrane-anchored ribosome-binding protein